MGVGPALTPLCSPATFVMTQQFPYLGFGIGLRDPHEDEILRNRPKEIDWLEIISENYIDAHEGYRKFLADLRKDYPIVMHGVSMNIGSTDPLDMEYLSRLKSLADFLEAPWVSDHICFTGMQRVNTHDLLPIPYTDEALKHLTSRIHRVQDTLGRPLVLENPSTYIQFTDDTMSEWEFIAELLKSAGCFLLLDVNNVYVSSVNHGFNPQTYISAIPPDRVVQIHLAGHLNKGDHIIDTHDHPVCDEVWRLYEYTVKRMGPKTTMIERDDDIPPLATLLAELNEAKTIATRATQRGAA